MDLLSLCLWFCSGGGSVSVADQPWQFRPESYGAKGDGQIATDVSTNGTSTITSPTIAADPNAVGKWIMVNGANGNPGVPLLGKITAVAGNNVTLNAAAGATVSNCAAVWASDDTSAINQAVTAAANYATANNYLAEVLFKDKIYGSATLTQQQSPVLYNTQIPVPYPNVNGQTRKLMITFRGAGRMSPAQYWESIQPNIQGSAIVSFLTAPGSVDATYGQQSVIGSSTGSGAFTGAFQNTHLTVLDMSVWCGAYTNIKALDMTLLSGEHLDGYSSQVFAPANNLAGASIAHPYLADLVPQALFQSSIGIGIVFPAMSNNDSCTFGSICVEGYEIGIKNAFDHLTGDRLAALYCDVIIRADPSQSHELAIRSVSAEVYNGGLRIVSGGGNILRLNIGWDGEVTSPAYDLSDASNVATGIFRWYDINRTAPTISNASGVKVINDRLGPGHMASPPAVPASTVAAALVYRDAWVSIHAGGGVTVSAITIDGTATGLTIAASSSLAVRVPSGKTIAITYAGGTPTWDWWLD